MNSSIIYILDFDGVICDSAVETGMSGWKAACQIWHDMPQIIPEETLALFCQVRPVIETGYEAILTMRCLFLEESVETIFKGYTAEFTRLMQQVGVTSDELKKLFGETRDAWIAKDKIDWVLKNPLYPGVAEKLQNLNAGHTWYVVTTKQERFVKKILNASQIELPADRIFGLERNLAKQEVLKILAQRHADQAMVFIEDRLPALQKVRQEPELAAIKLIFANWGYNCQADKDNAKTQGFAVQQLDQFLVNSMLD